MRGRNLFFTGLVIAVVGLLLILFRVPLADGGVVIAAGILFVLAGLLNMSVFLGSRDSNGKARMGVVGTAFGWIASAAAVVLGLSMLIFSKAFVAIVGFMFAVLLLFAALFQFFLLLFGSRPVRLSNWYFIVPGLLVAGALYIFLRKPDTSGETIDLIVTGIGFMLFGIATVVEGLTIGNLNRLARRSAKAASEAVLRGSAAAGSPSASKAEPEKPAAKSDEAK